MKKYLPAIIVLIVTFIVKVVPLFAITTVTFDPSAIPQMATGALSGNGQLLYVNNGMLDVVPNSYSTTTSSGGLLANINIGQYSNYPNPSGMLNLYGEAVNAPVLSSSFMGSTTSYVQTFMQNLNPAGSSDLVFADDKGNATSTDHYLDLGIANSTQVDSALPIVGPLDSYLFSKSGRLLIGSAAGNASSTIIISPNLSTTTTYFRWDQYGHLITKGPVGGSLSGCGTNPSQVGNDSNGIITLGTGISVTSCTKTFANTFPSGSSVSCSISTNSTLIQPALTAVSTTGFSVGLSLNLASGKVYYQCMASE